MDRVSDVTVEMSRVSHGTTASVSPPPMNRGPSLVALVALGGAAALVLLALVARGFLPSRAPASAPAPYAVVASPPVSASAPPAASPAAIAAPPVSATPARKKTSAPPAKAPPAASDPPPGGINRGNPYR